MRQERWLPWSPMIVLATVLLPPSWAAGQVDVQLLKVEESGQASRSALLRARSALLEAREAIDDALCEVDLALTGIELDEAGGEILSSPHGKDEPSPPRTVWSAPFVRMGETVRVKFRQVVLGIEERLTALRPVAARLVPASARVGEEPGAGDIAVDSSQPPIDPGLSPEPPSSPTLPAEQASSPRGLEALLTKPLEEKPVLPAPSPPEPSRECPHAVLPADSRPDSEPSSNSDSDSDSDSDSEPASSGAP